MALPTLEQLSKATRGDLLKLRSDVEEALKANEIQAKADAKAKIEELLAQSGFAMEDLFGQSVATREAGGARRPYKKRGEAAEAGEAKAPLPPKYAHPENSEMTWSGRGRQPDWIKSHLEAGKPLDELLIK